MICEVDQSRQLAAVIGLLPMKASVHILHGDSLMESATAKPAVLLIGQTNLARQQWEEYSDVAEVLNYPEGTRDDFISRCKSGAFGNIVAVCRSNEWIRLTRPFDLALIESLPRSVRSICSNGAGYDAVDVPVCTKRGIAVSNKPDLLNDSTSDTTILLILGALRRITVPLIATRNGEWKGDAQLGYSPRGKLLGIVGMGGIGTHVARQAEAFGMKVQYTNRFKSAASGEGLQTAQHVDLDQLIRTSNVISLNVPLDSRTSHLISTPQFEPMKDGVTIINTSRGKVVDEAALAVALRTSKVYAVGLDVFENEPGVHPELLMSLSVVLLPHIATFTVEARRSVEQLVVMNLRKALVSGRLVTQIEEQNSLPHL